MTQRAAERPRPVRRSAYACAPPDVVSDDVVCACFAGVPLSRSAASLCTSACGFTPLCAPCDALRRVARSRQRMAGGVRVALLAALLLVARAQAEAVKASLVGPHVPHFAGIPCDDGGKCPWGPSCTVCGQYCGPGWCGGSCVNEGPGCDFSVPPQEGSCTDACCQLHDRCCGCVVGTGANASVAQGDNCDKTACNAALASCLAGCPWNDHCDGPDGRWGPKLIELVFQLDKRRCCGSKCDDAPPPTASIAAAGFATA